ncbi:MAG: hypothetical protein JWN10_2084 [Solirubrobacterales bacterium]|nr:hypothetical protein [Solirubrobacterales bacterium]
MTHSGGSVRRVFIAGLVSLEAVAERRGIEPIVVLTMCGPTDTMQRVVISADEARKLGCLLVRV